MQMARVRFPDDAFLGTFDPLKACETRIEQYLESKSNLAESGFDPPTFEL